MLLAYVDESYSSSVYYIAALLCADREATSLSTALDEVVRIVSEQYPGIASDAELHGYDIFQGRGDWASLAKAPRARIGVYNKAFQAIAEHDVKIIIRGVDVGRLHKRYGDRAEHPHAITLSHLLERIDEYADSVDELALVIADEPGQHDQQARYRTDLKRYRISGTSGYRARVLTNIIDTLHFAPSSASRLVQAADLIAFLYHRMETKSDGDPRALRANQALWNRVRPRIHHCLCWMP